MSTHERPSDDFKQLAIAVGTLAGKYEAARARIEADRKEIERLKRELSSRVETQVGEHFSTLHQAVPEVVQLRAENAELQKQAVAQQAEIKTLWEQIADRDELSNQLRALDDRAREELVKLRAEIERLKNANSFKALRAENAELKAKLLDAEAFRDHYQLQADEHKKALIEARIHGTAYAEDLQQIAEVLNTPFVPSRKIVEHVKELKAKLAAYEKVEELPTYLPKAFAEAFLRWPLPKSVCADLCATMCGYENRVGTNLLSFVEAEQMAKEVVMPFIAPLQRKLAAFEGAKEVAWCGWKLNSLYFEFETMHCSRVYVVPPKQSPTVEGENKS